MSEFTAGQLPAIARRILAERDVGREVDPHRIAWANDILAWWAGDAQAGRRVFVDENAADGREPQPEAGA